jgi:hypothetical protein
MLVFWRNSKILPERFSGNVSPDNNIIFSWTRSPFVLFSSLLTLVERRPLFPHRARSALPTPELTHQAGQRYQLLHYPTPPATLPPHLVGLMADMTGLLAYLFPVALPPPPCLPPHRGKWRFSLVGWDRTATPTPLTPYFIIC